MKYLNVYTSNIFTINLTIATMATRESILTTPIGGTINTSSGITTITITFTIITITTTITIATIIATTGATSVINKILKDTGEVVSELRIRWIRARAEGAIIISIIIITQTIIQIRILMTNNTPLHGSELAEWVGFNQYDDNFDYH